MTTKVPIKDDAGRVQSIVTVSLDISERKRAEAELRESEERLRRAQDQAKIGYWRWSFADSAFSHWSETAARIAGFDSPELSVGPEEMTRSVHPEDRQRVIDEYRAADREKRGFELECRVIGPDGGIRHVHEVADVEYDVNGEPVAQAGFVQDITDLKKAEQALREREGHIAAIMENVADALVTIDTRGIIESVNPATSRLFGYDAEELIGRNVSMLMPEPQRSEHDGFLQRYLTTGRAEVLGVAAREVTGQRKDGTAVSVGLTVSEMRHGPKWLFIGAMRDISERKAAETALRQKAAFEHLSRETAAAANEAKSVEAALKICLREVCRYIAWPVGHAYMVEEDGGTLAPTVIRHLKAPDRFDAFRRATKNARFAAG